MFSFARKRHLLEHVDHQKNVKNKKNSLELKFQQNQLSLILNLKAV